MSDSVKQSKKRPIISGIIWLGLGLFLLTMSEGWLPSIEDSWPILIVIVGLALIVGAFTKHNRPTCDPEPPPPPPI